MKNEFKLEELTRQVLEKLPADLGKFQEDVEKNLRAALHATFSKLDLVSREEFDIQTKLLSRTRQMLDELEKKIEALEAAKKP